MGTLTIYLGFPFIGIKNLDLGEMRPGRNKAIFLYYDMTKYKRFYFVKQNEVQ